MRSGRRRAPARVSWSAVVEAFLLVTDYTVVTRATYRGQLKRAGELLGNVPLAELTAAALEGYRAAVLEGPRGSKSQALAVVRVFLLWAAEHGLHPLRPETIREALRPPGATGAVEAVGRTRWRRQDEPEVAADSFVSAGYPPGTAGLYLVSEEIQALREALIAADRERWAELVRRTDHPVNRRLGGGAAAALKALREAASGRRNGGETAVARLGYEGPAGERRLLANLRELRAALAAQQHSSLGRTVWRLRWTEEPIPILPDREVQPF